MARQAPVDPAEVSPPAALQQGVKEFVHDVVVLGELQAKLLRADIDAARTQFMRPCGALAASGAAALATLPIILLGLAHALTMTGLPLWAALLIVGGVALSGCVVAGWNAWRMLHTVAAPFERSQQELRLNLEWIKQSLSRPTGTYPSPHSSA